MAEIGTNIEHACTLLSEGKLVSMPTDTVYGLAASALNAESIEKIYKVKRRGKDKPLIAMTPSLKNASSFLSKVPTDASKLAEKYWPGALTMVLPVNDSIPKIMVSGGETIGLRVPNHPMALDLLKAVPFPLAVTSANLSNHPSPTSAEEVDKQIGDQIDFILDAGKSPLGIESTIVGFTHEKPVILRSGAIAEDDIFALLK